MKTMVIRTPNESAVMISQASDGFCYSGVLFALATCDHSAYRTSSPWYSGIPTMDPNEISYLCMLRGDPIWCLPFDWFIQGLVVDFKMQAAMFTRPFCS
jgi:hypothetical protein